MARQLCLLLRQETVDVKAFRVGPHLGVAVQRGQHHRQAPVLADQVAAAQQRIFKRRHGEGGRGGPQAQRFLQHTVQHRQPRQVGVDRRSVAGQHGVHLRVSLCHHARVAQ
ncbi:hypothetical protein D9M72_497960 [compost metagenome]